MRSQQFVFGLCVAMMTQAAVAQDTALDDTVELPVTTEAELQAIIGAPLISNQEKYERTQGPEYELTNDQSVYVIGADQLKPAGTWTDADNKACEQSGGVPLEISAGRVACFRL